MTKPRATWVLWVKWEAIGWQPEFEVTPLNPYRGGKFYTEMITAQWMEYQLFGNNAFRILPAGRKPKEKK